MTAKVEDDDVVGSLWLVVSGAVGRGRVERYFQVGLDLGIVRGKDAMAGIGLLAVDGFAALRSID